MAEWTSRAEVTQWPEIIEGPVVEGGQQRLPVDENVLESQNAEKQTPVGSPLAPPERRPGYASMRLIRTRVLTWR
jgi:hypothetical protein